MSICRREVTCKDAPDAEPSTSSDANRYSRWVVFAFSDLLATTVVSTGVVTHLARVTIEILREPRSYLISRMLILSPLASEIIILIIES
jgi:hypothetical protein